jgi:aspartate racemase
MEGPVYPSRLKPMHITHSIPDAPHRLTINSIIFDELVKSRFLPESRAYFSELIQGLRRSGCDGVVLGCTEIPLLISQEDSVLPVFDSTRLLARAALKAAEEQEDKRFRSR